MKMSEIKDLSLPELNKKLRELGEEFLKLQVRKQTGQVERPHVIKQIRRDRARIMTMVKQLKANNHNKLIILHDSGNNRNNRKELIGVVRSKTGDKSVKVVYEYKTPHPLYKKKSDEKQPFMSMMRKMIPMLVIKLELWLPDL